MSVYSGHKKVHGLNYMVINAPNGLIVSFRGPYTGRHNDNFAVQKSDLLNHLRYEVFHCFFSVTKLNGTRCFSDKVNAESETAEADWKIFGDSIYAQTSHFRRMFRMVRNNPSRSRRNLNFDRVRVSVEWSIGYWQNIFRLLDSKKSLKLFGHVSPNELCTVSLFLSNCKICLAGNQVSLYFMVPPPSLDEYLSGEAIRPPPLVIPEVFEL